MLKVGYLKNTETSENWNQDSEIQRGQNRNPSPDNTHTDFFLIRDCLQWLFKEAEGKKEKPGKTLRKIDVKLADFFCLNF